MKYLLDIVAGVRVLLENQISLGLLSCSLVGGDVFVLLSCISLNLDTEGFESKFYDLFDRLVFVVDDEFFVAIRCCPYS